MTIQASKTGNSIYPRLRVWREDEKIVVKIDGHPHARLREGDKLYDLLSKALEQAKLEANTGECISLNPNLPG